MEQRAQSLEIQRDATAAALADTPFAAAGEQAWTFTAPSAATAPAALIGGELDVYEACYEQIQRAVEQRVDEIESALDER